jgi:hypothetical protein
MIIEIKTPEQLRARPDIIEMLNRLAIESEEALDNNLRRSGSRLLKRLTREQSWQVNESFIDSMSDGKTSIIVSEKDGVPVAVLGYIENKQEIAERLRIENNFVMFFKALTEESHRSAGIFKQLLQYSLRDKPDSLVIGCVSNKKAITDEGVVFDHVMNLDIYANMMLRLFPESKLQVRYQSPNGRQYGKEKFDLKEILTRENKDAIQEIIREHENDGDKKQVGFYIHSR